MNIESTFKSNGSQALMKIPGIWKERFDKLACNVCRLPKSKNVVPESPIVPTGGKMSKFFISKELSRTKIPKT